MRGKCLDEGMLQSYLDGELSPELTAAAAAHLAGCDACADALGAAQAESAFFATAFAPDASLSVPSERLRERLDTALAGMETRRAEPRRASLFGLGAIAAWLSQTFNFEPRFAGAFASLAALVLLASIIGVVYLRNDRNQQPVGIARDTQREQQSPSAVATQEPTVTAPLAPAVIDDKGKRTTDDMVAGNKQQKAKLTNAVRRADDEREPKDSREEVAPVVEVAAQRSVPGEENYLRTIASLEKVVEVSGPTVLRPKMRSEYERNIAVIDRAIEDTRKAALRNPQDADTAAFLFSAYQNKIELLTTVADQAQVATLGR